MGVAEHLALRLVLQHHHHDPVEGGHLRRRRLTDGADDERDDQGGALHGDSTSRLRQKWKPTKAASASTTITAPPISPYREIASASAWPP